MEMSLDKSRRTKEELEDEINSLLMWAPIKTKDGIPESLDELKILINRLE